MNTLDAPRRLDPVGRWVLDAGLAAAAAAVVFVPEALTDPARLPAAGWLLGLAGTVPLAWRRRAPVAVLVIMTLAQAVSELSGLLPGGYAVLAISVALYTVAVQAMGRAWVRLAGAVAAGALSLALLAAQGPAMAAWAGAVCAAGWLAGEVIATRRAYLDEAREKTRWLEAARDQEIRLAVAEERARIARELHDIVAHAMSLIALRAGVGAHLAHTDPDEAAEALRVIEHASRDALAELRRMLGILRADAAPRQPAEDLDALPALCERVTGAGVPVTLDIHGRPRPLPASLQLNAYRIVQEALTNSLKHGHGSPVSVTVEYGDDALEVDILDHATPHSPDAESLTGGQGLRGISERAGLFGGSAQAGPLPAGGFRVHAHLPLAHPVLETP